MHDPSFSHSLPPPPGLRRRARGGAAAGWRDSAPGPCTPGAARRGRGRASLAHARPPRVASPGSVFSRGGLLEDRLVQLGLGQEPFQAAVLLLQVLEPLRLVELQAAVPLAPAVVGL